jgi:glycosyltransferase involved in cell wall biosynthesis
VLTEQLTRFKSDGTLFAIIGNIRKEKNYELAIEALALLPKAKLVIAGSLANSEFKIADLQSLAEERKVNNRILWVIRYLDEHELASVITQSSCVILNYAASFASQSGILNMIAPFEKTLIVSDTASALTHLVKRFKLGVIIPADNSSALESAMEKVIKEGETTNVQWKPFLQYASWEHHVKTLMTAYAGL